MSEVARGPASVGGRCPALSLLRWPQSHSQKWALSHRRRPGERHSLSSHHRKTHGVDTSLAAPLKMGFDEPQLLIQAPGNLGEYVRRVQVAELGRLIDRMPSGTMDMESPCSGRSWDQYFQRMYSRREEGGCFPLVGPPNGLCR